MDFKILLLALLVACSAVNEASTKPAVVNSYTEKEAPILLETEEKVPPPVPEVNDVVIETVQNPPKVIGCTDDCNMRCEESAQNACTQKERFKCRALCGDIIAPSACTQACALLSQPSTCRQQFEQFCKAQCVNKCYEGEYS